MTETTVRVVIPRSDPAMHPTSWPVQIGVASIYAGDSYLVTTGPVVLETNSDGLMVVRAALVVGDVEVDDIEPSPPLETPSTYHYEDGTLADGRVVRKPVLDQ